MDDRTKTNKSTSAEGFDEILKDRERILDEQDSWKQKARETLDRLDEDQETEELSLNEGE